MRVNTLDLIGWIVTMAEDDPRLKAVNRLRLGIEAEIKDVGPPRRMCARWGGSSHR